MRAFKRLILMIQFLTTIPVPINLDVSEEDFGKGLLFAPLVGFLIGGIIAGSFFLLRTIFPPSVTAVFIIILYIVLTGGIHLDGLGDTSDGIFSNRPKERMLEIMRDSRVGTNAVLAVFCVLALDAVIIGSINSFYIFKVLLLMPVAGRIGSLTGAAASTYARNGTGLGKSFIDCCGIREVIPGIILYSLLFYAITGVPGVLLCIFSFISAFVLVKLLGKKIGGATGDILGAVCELNQTLFLILAYVFIHFKVL